MARRPPADAKHDEAGPDPAEHIKLDKSRPYVRVRTTLPSSAVPKGPRISQQRLVRDLAEAWRLYSNSDDDGRRGVRLALAVVNDHIATADPQAGEVLDRFVTVLVAALDDLDRGITAPLVKKSARRGRETDSFGHRDIQNRAATAMASLMDANAGRDAAAKKVVAALAKGGFRTTKRAVEKWYDERLPGEVKQRTGRPPKSSPGVQDGGARLNYVLATYQHRDGKSLLEELTWFARLWFPSGSKMG